QREGVDLSGEVALVLRYGPVSLSDNGARFRVVARNGFGAITSPEAILTVIPDTTAPAVVAAFNEGATTIRLIFNEPVSIQGAGAPAAFSITPSVNISSSQVANDPHEVLLTTDSLAMGTQYTISFSRVFDRATTPNIIAANSQVSFTAGIFAPA